MFVETFLAGLAVLAVSGLAFLAYREPRAFEIVYAVLVISLIVGAVGLAIWNTNNLRVWLVVDDYIAAERRDEARQAFDALQFDLRYLWGVPVALAYLTFLLYLPQLSGKHSHDEEDHDIDGKPK